MKKKRETANREVEEPSCPHCQRPSTTGYGPYPDDDFIKAFRTVRTLKNATTIVACPGCGSLWHKSRYFRFPEDTSVTLKFIPADALHFVDEWERRKLSPTAAQLLVLKEIGATPPDAYTNGSEFIQFPCQVRLKSGRTIDCCTIVFSAVPPGIDGPPGEMPLFLDDVDEIRPSPYTLPRHVRYATTQAHEIRMSFAPTVVRLPTGGFHVFNWTTNFFATTKIKGSDIHELAPDVNPFTADTQSSDSGEGLAVDTDMVYADWDSSLLGLEITDETMHESPGQGGKES